MKPMRSTPNVLASSSEGATATGACVELMPLGPAGGCRWSLHQRVTVDGRRELWIRALPEGGGEASELGGSWERARAEREPGVREWAGAHAISIL